jgi:hypothetical protein
MREGHTDGPADRERHMLELSTYRLQECPTAPGVFEFFDPETERLVGVACPETQEPAEPSRVDAVLRPLVKSRFGCLVIPVWLVAAILGLSSPPPKRRTPRLTVRRSGLDDVVFELRVSSGLFYDSRIVSDGLGVRLAQFRGHSKIALGRMSFGMIDLGGVSEETRNYDVLPWLGRVEPSGDGVFRFSLVGDREAGRVVVHRASPDGATTRPTVKGFDIEAGPRLRDNPTGQLLLLAAALALAWRPPPG